MSEGENVNNVIRYNNADHHHIKQRGAETIER